MIAREGRQRLGNPIEVSRVRDGTEAEQGENARFILPHRYVLLLYRFIVLLRKYRVFPNLAGKIYCVNLVNKYVENFSHIVSCIISVLFDRFA